MAGYILEFYIHKFKLVVEVDGEIHDNPEAKMYDAERTKILEGLGLRVVRFTNREVLEDFEGVCAKLDGLLGITPRPP